MSTLHLVNRNNCADLQACATCLQAQDAVLFLEDATYLLLADNAQSKRELVQTLDNCPQFALAGDLVARGISARIPARIRQVDYVGFVELTLQYDRVITW